MRRTFISTTWTERVDPEDVRTLLRAIEDVYILLRRRIGRYDQFDPLPTVRAFGAWSLPELPQGAAYRSMDWYMQHSMDDAQRAVLASRFIKTVQLEPWQIQNPHFDLCMTDLPLRDDMTVGARGPALGFSRRGLASLITTSPFNMIGSHELRRLALAHVCAHYIGSLFDVPLATRAERIEEHRGGLFCLNTCARRRAGNLAEVLRYAREQASSGIIFCETCQQEMLGQITAFYYGVN